MMNRSQEYRRGRAQCDDQVLHDVPMWHIGVEESGDPHYRAEPCDVEVDRARVEQDDTGDRIDPFPVGVNLLEVIADEVLVLLAVVLLVDQIVERHDAPSDAGKSDSCENHKRPRGGREVAKTGNGE